MSTHNYALYWVWARIRVVSEGQIFSSLHFYYFMLISSGKWKPRWFHFSVTLCIYRKHFEIVSPKVKMWYSPFRRFWFIRCRRRWMSSHVFNCYFPCLCNPLGVKWRSTVCMIFFFYNNIYLFFDIRGNKRRIIRVYNINNLYSQPTALNTEDLLGIV